MIAMSTWTAGLNSTSTWTTLLRLTGVSWTTIAPPVFHLPPFCGQWSIWHHDYRLPCWTLECAQTILYLPQVSQFWDKRLCCPSALSRYDWPSSALALRRLPTPQRLWIPKWLCSTLPTGNNLLQWGQPDLLPCPRCGDDELHCHHVITCRHAAASSLRHKLLDDLSTFLNASTTEPEDKHGIILLLGASYSAQPWNPRPTESPSVQRTYDNQRHLGTDYVLDGFLSPYWAQTQHTYYEGLGRKTTGTQWAGRVIRRIWQIAWELWLHRRRILESVDNHQLAAIHMQLDDAIDLAYNHYHSSPDPFLARWFSRPSHELHRETPDWKTQWLEMISATTPPA